MNRERGRKYASRRVVHDKMKGLFNVKPKLKEKKKRRKRTRGKKNSRIRP